MSNKKVSELEEASAANEYDYLMIIQNGVNKKIQASKIGTGQSGSGGDTFPIGAIIPYFNNGVPDGYLLCDGSAVSRETYSELFAVLGETCGEGDGTTTFNLPDLRGKVTVGKDSTDADFDTLGNTGGEKTHNLTIDELPLDSFKSKGDSTGGWTFVGLSSASPHNNLQPYIVTNYIIKAKQKPNVLAIEDSLPIGTVLDYEGETVPQGYEIVNDSIIIGQEFKTGRIIGNKIEYGKIIVINSLPNTDETLYQTGINVSNIEITDCKGIAKAANNTTFPLPFASAAGSENNIQLNLRQSGQEYNIVIQVGRDRTELTGRVEIDYLKI